MSDRATGYIPDPESHQVTSFRVATKLGAAQVPNEVDHRPYAPPVLDQNNTSSCVGHAIACAVATSFMRKGQPLGFIPSPRDIYTLSRGIDRVSPSEPLIDVGTMPNQAVRALGEWGIRPMRAPSPIGYDSDCDETNVNNEPTLLELEQDATTVLVGQYEIDSFGQQRIDDLCAAVASGYAVTCSVTVNDNWRKWKPVDGPFGAQHPVQRNHYVWIIGYRTVGDKRIFRLRNQWGTQWGDHGEIEVTEEFMAQVGDLYVFNVRKAAA